MIHTKSSNELAFYPGLCITYDSLFPFHHSLGSSGSKERGIQCKLAFFRRRSDDTIFDPGVPECKIGSKRKVAQNYNVVLSYSLGLFLSME
jgi:hypothetical protein